MKKIQIRNVIISMISLYLFLFIIIPYFVELFWRGAEDVFYPTLFIVFFIGMFFISDKLRYWLIGDFLYGLCVLIHHPKGAYGIGIWGLFEASEYSRDIVPLHVLIHVVLVLCIQFGIWIIVKSIKSIIKLSKQKKHY